MKTVKCFAAICNPFKASVMASCIRYSIANDNVFDCWAITIQVIEDNPKQYELMPKRKLNVKIGMALKAFYKLGILDRKVGKKYVHDKLSVKKYDYSFSQDYL